MVGQEKLKKELLELTCSKTYPRFAIVVGEDGSEKNEFGYIIAKCLGANYVCIEDVKVDTIRNMITEAYKVQTPTLYNIINADGMSIQARNSLLKVTEEPPNKAYFVMTLEDENNTLPTIKSRGQVFKLDPYTANDLLNYARQEYNYSDEQCNIVLKLCETPGDIDILKDPVGFYEFVNKVVDNIATTSGSNSFKISNTIALKNEEDKYNLKLFWRAFCNVCLERKLLSAILITSKYMSLLRIKTINRTMLFDKWILDIRKEWKDAAN